MDVDAHALELLADNAYLVLGTTDAAGSPWVTPVWFAPDGLDRLHWLSWPGSRHSRLVQERAEVALTVFDSRAEPGAGTAFYAVARARECSEEEVADALRIINLRATAHGITTFTRERVIAPARLRTYVAEVLDAWVLDQDSDVDDRIRVPGVARRRR